MDKDKILAAQNAWAQGIVKIGAAFTNGGNYVEAAKNHIKDLYAYDDGLDVLFKPTKCAARQFRPTAEGALSYFVGANAVGPEFPEDKGFAIAPFIAVQFINASVAVHGDTGLAMGNYYFTSPDGTVTKVEYSFGYVMVGKVVKIVLHHSSLPYAG